MKRLWYLVIFLALLFSCSPVPQKLPSSSPIATAVIKSTEITSPVISPSSTSIPATTSPRPTSTNTLTPEPTLAPSPTPTLKPIEEFRLTEFQPLALNYASKNWSATKIGKYNSLGLINAQIAGCYIREQGGTDVPIKFVRSTKLGKIAYSIYAWAGGESDSYERMYFADENSLVSKSNYKPVFSANIPNSAEKECIFQVEEVLATLHTTSREP